MAEVRMNVIDRNPPLEEIDRALFRAVMGRFATGVTIITTKTGDITRGMTANAFMSGSLVPPLCIISVAKRAHMHGALLETGKFGVSILNEYQEALAPHFAGKPDAGMDVKFRETNGIPTLNEFAACLTAETVAVYECGDHTLFVGHIRHMEAASSPPLLYHAGHYGTLVDKGRIADDFFPITEFW
jgi:flavin reductase (DIM6/NTAB) family NADH-FMN oxidoreductase RutF